MTPAQRSLDHPAQPARITLIASLIFVAASSVILALAIQVDVRRGINPYRFENFFLLIPLISAVAAAVLARTRWYYVGVIQLLAAMWVAGFIAITYNYGLGLLVGASLLLVTVILSSVTLPRSLAGPTIVAGGALGILYIVADLFWPFSRSSSGLETQLPFIMAAILLALGYFLVRQFNAYSLGAKLTLTLVGVTVAAVAAVSFLTNLTTQAELTSSVAATLSSVAEVQAQSIGGLLSRYLSLLNSLAINRTVQDAVLAANGGYVGGPETIQSRLDGLDQQWRGADAMQNNGDTLVQRVLNNDLAAELREFSVTFPDNVEVFVTDVHGANVAATNRTSDYYQADEAWWQAAFQNGLGSTYIGQPELDESAGVYAVVMAAPVYSPERHEVIGVARTTIRLTALQALLSSQLATAGHTDLLLPDGTLFTSDGQSVRLPSGVAAQLNDPAAPSLLELNLHGEQHLTARARVIALDQSAEVPVSRVGWRVVVEVDPQTVYAPLTTATRTAVLVSLGALVVVTGLALLVARQLSGPIVRLTAVAEQVRGGDLTAQARIESQDEIGALASTFNTMTNQLRETLSGLEQRVADRTRALAASAEVSRRLSTILDQKQLVAQVVEQVQSAFNFYHAHIYLFDEAGENLVMAGGTGPAGATMLARGHKLARGRGLVGRAAETNAPVLVPDVTQEPSWLANPLLPDTKAEVAVPIAAGGRVLGVLDVQHNVLGGLTPDDAALLRAVADQVAVALQNARLYTAAQQQAQRETLLAAIGRKIQSAGTVEGVLQVAARELGTALSAKRAAAHLGLRERDEDA